MIGMHIGSVLSELEAEMTAKCRMRSVNVCIGCRNDGFPKFGDLEGDFYKERVVWDAYWKCFVWVGCSE